MDKQCTNMKPSYLRKMVQAYERRCRKLEKVHFDILARIKLLRCALKAMCLYENMCKLEGTGLHLLDAADDVKSESSSCDCATGSEVTDAQVVAGYCMDSSGSAWKEKLIGVDICDCKPEKLHESTTGASQPFKQDKTTSVSFVHCGGKDDRTELLDYILSDTCSCSDGFKEKLELKTGCCSCNVLEQGKKRLEEKPVSTRPDSCSCSLVADKTRAAKVFKPEVEADNSCTCKSEEDLIPSKEQPEQKPVFIPSDSCKCSETSILKVSQLYMTKSMDSCSCKSEPVKVDPPKPMDSSKSSKAFCSSFLTSSVTVTVTTPNCACLAFCLECCQGEAKPVHSNSCSCILQTPDGYCTGCWKTDEQSTLDICSKVKTDSRSSTSVSYQSCRTCPDSLGPMIMSSSKQIVVVGPRYMVPKRELLIPDSVLDDRAKETAIRAGKCTCDPCWVREEELGKRDVHNKDCFC